LIEALDDEDANVRASVVRALGSIVWRTRCGSESEPAIPLLIDVLLHDADANVRGHAARTLGCIGRHVENEAVLKPAIQPLIKALQDEAKFDASAPSEPPSERKVCTVAAFALAMMAPRVRDEAALSRAIPFVIEASDWLAEYVLGQMLLAVEQDEVLQVAIAAHIEALREDDPNQAALVEFMRRLEQREDAQAD
jgi:HEAT repeat protein